MRLGHQISLGILLAATGLLIGCTTGGDILAPSGTATGYFELQLVDAPADFDCGGIRLQLHDSHRDTQRDTGRVPLAADENGNRGADEPDPGFQVNGVHPPILR